MKWQEVKLLVSSPGLASGNSLRWNIQDFESLSETIRFTKVCEGASFQHNVSAGMNYKTRPDEDDGYGKISPLCREFTNSRVNPRSRVFAAFPGGTIIGPDIEVQIVKNSRPMWTWDCNSITQRQGTDILLCVPNPFWINSPRPEKSNSNYVNCCKKGQILNFRRRRIIRPKGNFSKHFRLIHLSGLRVLKHFSKLFFTSFHLYHSPFSLSSSLFFFMFSLVSSCSSCLFFYILYLLFSCFFSSLLLSLLLSLVSCLLCLVFSSLLFSSPLLSAPLFSSLLFIFSSLLLIFSSFIFSCLFVLSRLLSCCLVLSCLSLSLFSLSLSLSVPLCPCLRVLLWWLLCRVVWCGTLKTTVCTFETSPCVPAPRPHEVTLAGVVPVHTGTFWMCTRESVYKELMKMQVDL